MLALRARPRPIIGCSSPLRQNAMRKIVCIEWRESDHRTVLHYDSGDSDDLVAPLGLVMDLVQDEGLTPVLTQTGVSTWQRQSTGQAGT